MNSIRSGILSLAEFPSECSGGVSVVEIKNGNETYIEGCTRVIDYESSEIRLRLKDNEIKLCGEGMTLSDFTGGTIRVDGSISAVIYLRGL